MSKERAAKIANSPTLRKRQEEVPFLIGQDEPGWHVRRRWIRLIDDAVEMFYEHITNRAKQPGKGTRTRWMTTTRCGM